MTSINRHHFGILCRLSYTVCVCVFVNLFVSFSSIRHDSRWPSWGLVALKISRLDWNTFYTNISSKINEISTKLAQLGLRLGIGLVLTCPRVSLILSQSQAIYIAPLRKLPSLPSKSVINSSFNSFNRINKFQATFIVLSFHVPHLPCLSVKTRNSHPPTAGSAGCQGGSGDALIAHHLMEYEFRAFMTWRESWIPN